MLSEKVIDMGRSFAALKECCAELAGSLRGDTELQMFLPDFDGDMREGRELAINAITRLWWPELDEPAIKYGFLCVSSKSANLALALNTAKTDFKGKIAVIKSQIKDDAKERKLRLKTIGDNDDDKKEQEDKNRIDKLVDWALNREGSRTPELNRVLKNMHLNRLDILKCYAAIRVLPESTRSVSYTWAVTHSSASKITVEEARIMVKSLQDENLKKSIEPRLDRLDPREILVHKKKLPNQLRANITYMEDGEVKRSLKTVSGIMVCFCEQMPQVIWRKEPSSEEIEARLHRIDSTIESKPLIRALDIYRYINPQLKEPKASNEQ